MAAVVSNDREALELTLRLRDVTRMYPGAVAHVIYDRFAPEDVAVLETLLGLTKEEVEARARVALYAESF